MASEASACGDEKSAYPSRRDIRRSGIGLLDTGAAGQGRGGVSSTSRARLRERVGEAAGDVGGDADCRRRGYVRFCKTAKGLRSFTTVPSKRWCDIWRMGLSSFPGGKVKVPMVSPP